MPSYDGKDVAHITSYSSGSCDGGESNCGADDGQCDGYGDGDYEVGGVHWHSTFCGELPEVV